MPARNGRGIELLADPTRRAIVAMLALSASGPSRIAAALGLSRPAISRQLRLLQEAGLIRCAGSAADRRGLLYILDARHHGQITAWLAGTEIGRPITEPARDADLPGPGRAVVFGRGVRGLVRRPRPDLDRGEADAATAGISQRRKTSPPKRI